MTAGDCGVCGPTTAVQSAAGTACARCARPLPVYGFRWTPAVDARVSWPEIVAQFGGAHDAALWMPRGEVHRRKGRLRFRVEP